MPSQALNPPEVKTPALTPALDAKVIVSSEGSCPDNPLKKPTSVYVYGAVSKQGHFWVTLCSSHIEEFMAEVLHQSEGLTLEHAVYDKIYVINLSQPDQKHRKRVFDLKDMRFEKAGLFPARVNQQIQHGDQYVVVIPSDKDEHFMDLFKYGLSLAATFAVVFLGSASSN